MMQEAKRNTCKWLITAALVGGVALGAAGIAGAATSSTPSTPAASATGAQGNENATHEKSESGKREADEKAGRFGFGGHGTETVVTGTTAAKIKAAAVAAVPGTVTKVEQRSDGSYEAEITKADGTEVHVSLDKAFKVVSQNGRGDHSRPEATPSA